MNAKEKPTTKANKLTSKLCHNLLYTNKTATSIANVTTTEQFVSLDNKHDAANTPYTKADFQECRKSPAFAFCVHS